MRERPQGEAFALSASLAWALGLSTLLGLELVSLIARFEAPAFSPHDGLVGWVFANVPAIRKIGVWSAGLFLLNIALRLRLRAVMADFLSDAKREDRWVWLAAHVVGFFAFFHVTALIFEPTPSAARQTGVWLVLWLFLAAATLVLWAMALAPGRAWQRLARQQYWTLLLAFVQGAFLWILLGMLDRQDAPLWQVPLWKLLSGATLGLVRHLLSLFYPNTLYDPQASIVGVNHFSVEITYACSGIEGISLITLFVSVYLFVFRRDLPFPRALLLFPVAIVVVWLANAVRISALVAIGAFYSPSWALGEFHHYGGWVAVVVIAFGVMALSQRLLLERSGAARAEPETASSHLATALLVPFLVLTATSMVVAVLTISDGFQAWYPLQVVAAGVALWWFHGAYRGLGWSGSWSAIGIGFLVFVVWMLLEPLADHPQGSIAIALAELTGAQATAWVVFRVLGSVLVAPIVEELAFRGYLMRKLISRDFSAVPLGQITLVSLFGSSLLFGLLHGRWVAGTVAGLAYAWVLNRRGQIGDAVLAHMTTNGLIALWVLTRGHWALWS